MSPRPVSVTECQSQLLLIFNFILKTLWRKKERKKKIETEYGKPHIMITKIQILCKLFLSFDDIDLTYGHKYDIQDRSIDYSTL